MFLSTAAVAQSNVTVRIMAANLNGNTQSYQPFAIRLFQGLQPDVVAIQEFNYTSTNGANVNNAAAFREMVDLGFGTNYSYFREPTSGNGDIPNGIISRYPIIASGSWTDTLVANRGFAWAQIDLPGTNDLYIVSVHFLTSSSGNRASEAANLKTLMQANFPANAWMVVAGDFNAGTSNETCVTTWNGYLAPAPFPADKNGNTDTSANRNSMHDFVLPSLALTNYSTTTVYGTLSYPKGLVFDSRVYTANELLNFPPVQSADSGLAQHMAIIKDFLISATPATNPPVITAQPQGSTNAVGSAISISVTATGSGTLAYQWRFSGTNISGATTNPFALANGQLTNNGNYSVVITNVFGSVTSAVVVLLTTNAPPNITSQPQGQTVLVGQSATFSVGATGTAPLGYQWLFNSTNLISGASTNPFILANAQSANVGNYSVIVSNFAGSVTSSIAALAIVITNPTVFAQWNFNSLLSDTNTGTGVATPFIGVGTASLAGGATATFATGDTTLDPVGTNDNSGWNTATYPAQGSGNKTRGAQFAVSTAGKQNIAVSWSSQSSSTGSKYGRLQYSTNGTDFVDFPNAFTNGTSFTAKTNSLAAISAVNNNATFAFRFVSEFESTAIGTANANYAFNGSSYGTSGTMRYDMVTVSGTSLVSGGAAMLAPLLFTNGVFTLGVTGTITANYILQTSTNLSSTNWLPVFTNTSPFSFSESNLIAPQKFYRAVAP